MLHHVILVAGSQSDKKVIQALKSVVANGEIQQQQILLSIDSREPTSISSIWQKIINTSPQMFDNILPNSQPRKAEIRINYKDSGIHCHVQTIEGPVDIVQIIFRAKLSVTKNKVPITRITQYSKILEQDIIAQSAHFEIGVIDKVVDISLHNFGENDKTLLAARLEPK